MKENKELSKLETALTKSFTNVITRLNKCKTSPEDGLDGLKSAIKDFSEDLKKYYECHKKVMTETVDVDAINKQLIDRNNSMISQMRSISSNMRDVSSEVSQKEINKEVKRYTNDAITLLSKGLAGAYENFMGSVTKENLIRLRIEMTKARIFVGNLATLDKKNTQPDG